MSDAGMFTWRGFTIEESRVLRRNPFAAAAAPASGDQQQQQQQDDDDDESSSSSTDGDLAISPEWTDRLVSAHNSLHAKRAAAKRKASPTNNNNPVVEAELRQRFQATLEEYLQQ